MNFIVSSHLLTSRVIVLGILACLVFAFFRYSSNTKPNPVVREYYDCIKAVCTTLPGAEDVCVFAEARMSKITIVAEPQGKVIKISPSNDRCN